MERFRSACFVTFLVLNFVHGQYVWQSPCPEFFEYRRGGFGGVYGIVHLYPVGRPNLDMIEVRVDFTVTGRVRSRGHIQTLGVSEAALVRQFNSGSPIDFAVVFPESARIPKITSIEINGVVICTGPGDDDRSPSLSTVGLSHTFFATNSEYSYSDNSVFLRSMPFAPSEENDPSLPFENPVRPSWTDGSRIPNTPFKPSRYQSETEFSNFHANGRPYLDDFEKDQRFNRGSQTSAFPARQKVQNDDENVQADPITAPQGGWATLPPATRPPTTEPPTTPRPPPVITTPRPQQQSTQIPANTCGQKMTLDNTPVQPLIFGGMNFNRGDWPWLVAIFKRKDVSLTYICSGTLLSDRHVLTAAHYMHRTTSLTSIDDIVVKAGVHNILDWGDDEVTRTRTLSSATEHPAYNASTLSNDILLLKFTRPVPINAYIKPICIWSGTDDLNLVVGAVGVVAGWGVSEIGPAGRGEPRMVRMPIVSTTECRASKPDFHKLTSNSTLCAGDKNGAGPCLGDSGGGLYLVHDGRWTLRGIVSVSLVSGNGDLTCNLNEFVVFTDAAKYAGWILANM